MWCLKCFRKHKDRTLVLRRRHHNQIFKHWIFLIDGHNELLQIRNRHLKTDAADAMTVQNRKNYTLFIFCVDVPIHAKVTDDIRNGR